MKKPFVKYHGVRKNYFTLWNNIAKLEKLFFHNIFSFMERLTIR